MKITNENSLIGYQGESYSRELNYSIDESLKDCDIYFEFEKPDGSKIVSSKLNLELDTYLIPYSLLDEIGYLRVQLVAYRGDKFISKSQIYSFYITESINATAAMIEDDDNTDIIRELEITKADDLSYDDKTSILQLIAAGKKIGSKVFIKGISDYTELENQPMTIVTNLNKTNLVNLRSLESGLYRLYGYFKPYETSTRRFTVPAPLFVSLINDGTTTYMQMYFALNNLIQYYVLTDENYTRTDIKLNEMTENINTLKTDVDTLKTDVNDLDNRVTNLENNNELKTDIANVDVKVDDLKTSVNGLDAKLDDLKSNNTNVNTTITELNSKVDNLVGKIDALKPNDSISDSSINDIKTNVSEVDTKVDVIKANLAELSTKIDSLGSSGGGGSSDITTLKKILSTKANTKYLFSEYAGTAITGLISYDDTSDVIDMSYMFSNSGSLLSIPKLDTANVRDMHNMFYNCTKLINVPELNTSNVTNMSYMFYRCANLTSIPKLDTSKVTNMSNAFSYCLKLSGDISLDISNVTDISYMFMQCYNIINITLTNTSKVTNINSVIQECYVLNSFSMSDASNLSTSISSSAFNSTTKLKVLRLPGIKKAFDIHSSTAFEREDLVTLLNDLGTVTTSTTLTIGSTNLAKLTSEDQAIATSKGWILK